MLVTNNNSASSNTYSRIENNGKAKEVSVSARNDDKIQKQILESTASKASSPSNTSNVSDSPLFPNTNLYCNIFEKLGNFQSSEPKSNSANDVYAQMVQNQREYYLYLSNIYKESLQACDDDIRYCQDLIDNNDDPEHAKVYEELLERANNRKDNLTQQAADHLYNVAVFSKASLELSLRLSKALRKESVDENYSLQQNITIPDAFNEIILFLGGYNYNTADKLKTILDYISNILEA